MDNFDKELEALLKENDEYLSEDQKEAIKVQDKRDYMNDFLCKIEL